jgi:hopanoid-associated phosphorylase
MLGILCGLEKEAEIVRRIDGAIVLCSGARPELARIRAQELIARGATRLISFGLAAGLAPGLLPGTLYIGTAVQSQNSLGGGALWVCDGNWSAQLARCLPAARRAAVYAVDEIIESAEDKRAFYEKRHCEILDMESHCVAWAASEANLPFAVVRVVTDPADMELPPAAMVSIGPDGRLDMARIALSLMRHPLQLPSLIHVGKVVKIGLNVLREVVASGALD